MLFVGDRRQETGDRRNGNVEEVGARIVSQFFCHNHPKIPACMSFFHQKVGTFFNAKTLKPLSVNTFRINQQALINYGERL
ncbi:hypothetical protein [Okeania hirsuta]|uniref:Uncharacterized protein n=1 Tax=Okeania hirsuta TaxID=1458930 RepID=A0A3N6PWY0_9CYAN|nr:hypothetical protein [Okeania hirsuta]RQH24272.1 hypothetical protein D4Z78_04010 [Okeania hirsuta]RQH45453.1 hypothetical protein D5R40_10730 [Okeania hirsuta]